MVLGAKDQVIPARIIRWALVLATALLVLQGCAMYNKMSGKDAAAAKRVQNIQDLQLRVMRFGDEYAGGIIEPIRNFQATTDSPEERLAAQNWELTQATAAYTNASGPNPVTNALDMVVLATLSRMVIDDAWVGEKYGKRAVPLQEAHRRLEGEARALVKDMLTPAQAAQLQQVIDQWRAANPNIRAVTYIHFRDFAKATGHPGPDEGAEKGGLFALLGLDPLGGLDPAVRELAQTRQLAERAIYYAQRTPSLINMQVERLSYQFAVMPETQRMLTDADRVSVAAASAGHLADELPSLLAREREAAIRQFMESVSGQTAQTRALLTELHGALDAGTATSNSLTETIRSFDQLMGHFDKPKPPGAPPEPPRRPFDITEYTTAAAEFARTANDLQRLVASINGGVPALTQSANRAASTLQGVVDHILWRVLLVGALLLLAALGTALTYRAVVKRFA